MMTTKEHEALALLGKSGLDSAEEAHAENAAFRLDWDALEPIAPPPDASKKVVIRSNEPSGCFDPFPHAK